jgi:hypothetical protein
VIVTIWDPMNFGSMHLRTSSLASHAVEGSFIIFMHIRFKGSLFFLILKNLTQMTGIGPTNDLLENEKQMKCGMIEVKRVHHFSFWYNLCFCAEYQHRFFIIL